MITSGHGHHDHPAGSAGQCARPRLRNERSIPRPASIGSTTAAKPIISARPAAGPNSPPTRTHISTSTSRKPTVPEGTIYTCPMHPQIRQVGPGSCPICGMALEPEVASLDTPPNPELADMTRRFWVGTCARPAAVRSGDGRPPCRRPRLGRPDPVELDPARVRHPCRALGGLAVLRARLAIAADAQSQHVHPDRDGHGRGLCLQPHRHRRAAVSSRRPSAGMAARSRSTSKPPRSSPFSSCWGRCSSCARARRRPARSRRCLNWRRKPRGASATMAPTMRSRSTACRLAIGCASGRAKRCRWTASFSKAVPRSMNRW